MVDGDRLRELGKVLLEHRQHGRVLVLAVRVEQLDDAAHVAGKLGAPGPVGGVEAAGRGGDREQLGADALVDVAVQAEGHGLEASEDGWTRSWSWRWSPLSPVSLHRS